MNDETNTDPIDTPADPDVVEALRSTPEDLDEVFARRAISEALAPLRTSSEPSDEELPRVTRSRVRRRSRSRTRSWIGAAAAAVVVVIVATTAVVTSRRSSPLAIPDSATGAAESQRADFQAGAPHSADETHDAAQPGEDASEGIDALPYLGDFFDTAALVALVDELEARDGPETTDGTAPEASGPTDEPSAAGSGDLGSRRDVIECAEELGDAGYTILGWATIDDGAVVVVSEPSLRRTQVFDATTCTA